MTGPPQPLFDPEFLAWFTGWPLGLLCWGFVVYVVVMRMRW